MKPNWILELANSASLQKKAKLTAAELEFVFEQMSDPQDFVDACYKGDWDYFLEDNPGVKDAILSWLQEYWGSGKAVCSPEQDEALADLFGAKEEEPEEGVELPEPEASKLAKLPKKADNLTGTKHTYIVELTVESDKSENEVAGAFHYVNLPGMEVVNTSIREQLAGPKKGIDENEGRGYPDAE